MPDFLFPSPIVYFSKLDAVVLQTAPFHICSYLQEFIYSIYKECSPKKTAPKKTQSLTSLGVFVYYPNQINSIFCLQSWFLLIHYKLKNKDFCEFIKSIWATFQRAFFEGVILKCWFSLNYPSIYYWRLFRLFFLDINLICLYWSMNSIILV